MPIQDITAPIPFAGGYVQSMVTTLGLNGSPTTIDMTVIVDEDGTAGDPQTFQTSNVVPGLCSGIEVGALSFTGLVQSWRKSYSGNGISYTVRLADPRVAFDNVHVIVDGRGARLPTAANISNGQGIYNVINVYDHYGNDYDAQYTEENGMSWNKIRPVLESSGYINLYGRQFNLSFDDNFVAPEYYKVSAKSLSLNQLLQSVAGDLSIDYYAHIDPTAFDPNGVSRINVVGIKRSNEVAGDDIDDYIADRRAEGTLIAYERGQELSNYPTDGIVMGAPYTSMHSTDNMMTSFGRASDGRLLTAAANSSDLSASYVGLNDPERFYGYVLLDNITSTEPTLINSLPSITAVGRTVTKNQTYPIEYSTSILDIGIKGYRPTENVMRAALYSQESWEAILFNEQTDIAQSIGITALVVRSSDDVATIIQGSDKEPELLSDDRECWDRDPAVEAIISAVYERTKEYADKYYGREFVAEMPAGEIYLGSNGSVNFRYGYKVIDAVTDFNTPSYIANSGSEAFRTADSKTRAYVKLSNAQASLAYSYVTQNPDGVTNAEADQVFYDFSLLSKEEVIYNDTDAYIAVEAGQDETNLARAIIRLSAPIQYKSVISTSEDVPSEFVEFFRALGWTDDDIMDNILDFAEGYKGILGLAPKRVTQLDRAYIPIENSLDTFGPYVHVSNLYGGTYFNIDTGLSRDNYGTDITAAGNALVAQSVTNKTYVDSASLTIAGEPTLNLGDLLGDNAYITSLNINRSRDGLITNYGLQSFAFPLIKTAGVLATKVNKAEVRARKIENSLINLDEKIKEIMVARGKDYESYKHHRKETVYKTEPGYIISARLNNWIRGSIHG